MGSISRQARSDAFIAEFGVDIATAVTAARGHTVMVAADINSNVRMWIILDGYEYMAEDVIFEPEYMDLCWQPGEDNDNLEGFLELLGLEHTEDNFTALHARIKKAGLHE